MEETATGIFTTQGNIVFKTSSLSRRKPLLSVDHVTCQHIGLLNGYQRFYFKQPRRQNGKTILKS